MVDVLRIAQQDMEQMAPTTASLVLEVPTLTMMLVLQHVQEDTDRLRVPTLALSAQVVLQFLIITYALPVVQEDIAQMVPTTVSPVLVEHHTLIIAAAL